MDLILISVTALALAMAAGMAIVVATLLREERARSAARVAALSAMASDSTIAPVASPSARTPTPVFVTPPSRVPSAAADDLVIRPVAVDESTLFAPAVRPSPWGPRLTVIGALAAVIVAAAAVMISGSRNSAHTTPASVVAAPAADAPLELLSLSHSQQSDHIVISGLVQNPRNAAARAHIVATAFVFGPDGAFLSSSRAPLDFTTLTPGEESRFVVSVPVSTPVSRYRIGFRTEDGQVLPHVDKRAPDALAQK